MRILVLFAHPVETSFASSLHAKVVEVLRAKGHKVDDCDLHAEGFDPVMSRQDRIDYHNLAVNRRNVAPYVDRLLAAEALVFSFPVWNMGFPAILKGFIDKVFLPGVSFTLDEDGSCQGNPFTMTGALSPAELPWPATLLRSSGAATTRC